MYLERHRQAQAPIRAANGKQVNRKEPIWESWEKGNGNETSGIGVTVFWNPAGMEDKAPTAYDIKKNIEDGETSDRDYFDNRDHFNSRFNPTPAKLVFG
jgi:hypothetical protein